jgi:Periplasmic binding protein
MSRWTSVTTRYLLRVSLGYFALVWLLALAILTVFPLLNLPQGSVTLAIALLIIGFPIVLFVAWAFGTRPLGHRSFSDVMGAKATVTIRIERAVIVTLVLTVATLGVHQYLSEEPDNGFVADSVASEGPSRVSTESASGSHAQTVSIGIISPKEGSRSAPSGIAHEASIMLAFDRLGAIRTDTTEIQVQFIAWNDEGNPEVSRQLALKLAKEQAVAAILGPVNSSSTESVLDALRKADIDIPVISALSTARDLIVSGKRDRNFFRLIFNDADRMAALARFIETEKRSQGDQKFLFLYENDAYGKGLVDDLQSNFYSRNYEIAAWCELIDPGCRGTECIADTYCANGILDPRLYDAISTGDRLSPKIKDRLRKFEFDDVVLLGTIPGALAFSHGLRKFNDRLDYFFVGSNKQLFDEAPIGSVTIGNPVLDPTRAPNAELSAEWNDILSLFRKKYGQDPSDFVVTAYEAGMVMHSALRMVLQDEREVPPVQQLRRDLLNVLEVQRFDAVEPWRRIQFSDGRLTEPDTAPIYRIGRGRRREDTRDSHAWVGVDVEPQFSLMEGPIHVRLDGHSVQSARVSLSRVVDGHSEIIRSRDVVFSANRAAVDFHVFRTGLYRVSIEGVDYTPSSAQTWLVLTPTYAVSIITALFGALVVVLREPATLRARLIRVLLGMFAGFALTFSALYGTKVAGWIPFPKFGDEPYVNAIVTGLIGGLIGPYVLAEVFLSWALTLSVGTLSSKRAADIGEGL